MTTDNIDQTPSREEQIAANKARRAAAAANQKANYKPKNGHVDFRAVHDASLNSLDAVLQRYLPEGRRKGKEWIARNPTRADGHLGSFSVNRRTGVWSDFATGAKGGDPIDLVAYLTGSPKLDAARELGAMLGVELDGMSTYTTGNIRPRPAHRPPMVTVVAPEKSQDAPTFPPRTPPEDGKPKFIVASDEGPAVSDDDARRHVYRQGGSPVRMKVKLSNGNWFNVYRVTDTDGATGWQYGKPDKFLDIPYFTGPDPFKTKGPLYWPEGEKDVQTLERLGLSAFTFGGTSDVPEGCAAYVAKRAVVILADNHADGRNHAEAKAVAVHGIATSIKVIHFPETKAKGDVSDWIEAGHTAEELKARVDAAELWQPTAEEETQDKKKRTLPAGFGFTAQGLVFKAPPPGDEEAILVAGHFDIIAETRDGDGFSWGVLLHWKDHDGKEHRFALPRSTLAGDGSEARRILIDGGFYISPNPKARQLFNAFLLQVQSPKRARATPRIGWHGQAFVLPDGCFGEDPNDVLILQNITAHEHPFRQTGTLEDWKNNVAKYAAGNSRLAFAISAAFAGPLIGPCSAEGGGFHFKGASSIGKTTALYMAGSVWGGSDDPTGYNRQWRATANGLEGVATLHSDTLLCLDEMSQLVAKDAGEVAYMLANGAGKSRASKDGSARGAYKWRLLFLSSGEIGLADKVAEDGRGKKLAAGQQVRVIDIMADAGVGLGMFENLHGFASAEALARHLRSATRQHYGVAAREYLKVIVPDIDEVQKTVLSTMKAFCEHYVPEGADGQVQRVAQRFALIAVGGELAQQQGILPWDAGEAVGAAGKCFEAWLEARGGHDAAEARDGIAQVRSFLNANGMARFIPAWSAQETKVMPRDLCGYRQKTGDGWDYYITGSAWREEVCRGIDAKRLATIMAQRGHIDAGDGRHIAKTVRVPDYGKMRLYHVRSTFLEGDENA